MIVWLNEKTTGVLRKFKRLAHLSPATKGLDRIKSMHPEFKRAKESALNNQITETLQALAALEEARISGPLVAGRFVEQLVSSNDGLQSVLEPCENMLETYPNSILLLYLLVLALAKTGEREDAHEILATKIIEQRRHMLSQKKPVAADRRRMQNLMKIWRILDAIARDNMAWATGESVDGKGYCDLEFVNEFLKETPESYDLQISLFMLEPVLQGRHHETYLRMCREAYEKSTTIEERLRILRATWRQGGRRVPDYTEAYNQANMFYDDMKVTIDKLLLPFDKTIPAPKNLKLPDPIKTAGLLRSLWGVAKQLRREGDAARFKSALTLIANESANGSAFWVVLGAYCEYGTEHDLPLMAELVKEHGVEPKGASDLRNYWQWMSMDERFSEAKSRFAKLSTKIKRDRSSLFFVNLLQRAGSFQQAASVTRNVHASQLSRPHLFCPFTCYGLIRRAGELDFAAECANNFSMVPQPADPMGVIFVAPRSIEQLRRLPLVVLMELKRLGWAIIPTINGILPLEKTGIAAIDRYLGAISVDNRYSKAARNWMSPIVPVKRDYSNRILSWRSVDMSHALWEEAAVNRRVYDVNFKCPAIRNYLDKLADWTELSLNLTAQAQKDMAKAGLRAASTINFNYRLPDAGIRFYCEQFGDVEDFFCIHFANGYQNYFTNFSTNVSTKAVVRNITAHSNTRSASFPVPEEFNRFVEANRKIAPQILESVQDVTKVKRSTEGQQKKKTEALITLSKVREWRESGGKVACAFGKVVCDSGVPYDGGPAHANMKEWINHTIKSVKGSKTLLLIKPHPHELREEIGCFLNQTFRDLIEEPMGDNVMFLGNDWLDIEDLREMLDVALIYNGTTAIEMGVMGIPSILCSHFGPVDYPIGHITPKNKLDYRKLVRFQTPLKPAPDLQERAASWLYYMGSKNISLDYRYHARQITNKVVYPSWWFKEDIKDYFMYGDENVAELAKRSVAPSKPPDCTKSQLLQ